MGYLAGPPHAYFLASGPPAKPQLVHRLATSLMGYLAGPPNAYSEVLRYHKHFLHPGLHTGESLHGRRHWKVADVDVLHATLDQSMHAPRADLVGMDIACKVARQFVNRNWKKLREHCECLWTRASIVENAEDSGNFHA